MMVLLQGSTIRTALHVQILMRQKQLLLCARMVNALLLSVATAPLVQIAFLEAVQLQPTRIVPQESVRRKAALRMNVAIAEAVL
jgi:hypothetical protein